MRMPGVITLSFLHVAGMVPEILAVSKNKMPELTTRPKMYTKLLCNNGRHTSGKEWGVWLLWPDFNSGQNSKSALYIPSRLDLLRVFLEFP